MKIYLDNNLGVSNVEQEELTQDTIGYNILKVYIPNAVLTPYDTFTCYYGALLQNGRKVGWFAMEARTSSDADYEENYTLYKATLEQCIVSVEGKVYIGCQVLLGNSGNATLIKKNTAVVQFNVRKSVAINNDILVLDTDQTNTDVLESYKNLLENALLTYATKATTYTKTEVDGKLDLKADKSDTYTKTEINETAVGLMSDIDVVRANVDIISNETQVLRSDVDTLQDDVENLKSVQNVVEVVATKSALNSYDTTKLDIDDKVQVIADETHSGASTIYNWNGSAWQYVGAYGTNSYTKQETDTKLDLKADKSDTYTKSEVNASLSLKADKSDTYTKTETNNLLGAKADKTTVEGIDTRVGALETDVEDLKSVQNVVDVVATKSALTSYDTSKLEANDKIQVIADESQGGASTIYNWTGSAWSFVGAFGGNSYTKSETDALLDDKADKSTTYTKTEVDTLLSAKANASTTYSKTETDSAIATAESNCNAYTDNAINDLKWELGSHTLDVTTDSDTSFSKSVPSGAIGCQINKLGGMSYKCLNLANASLFEIGAINLGTGGDDSRTDRMRSNYIEVKPNTQYTLKWDGNDVNYVLYNENKEKISNTIGGTFTTTTTTKYIRFYSGLLTTSTQIMLNEGSTALPYQPYFDGIRDSAVTSVVSKDSNDTTIATLTIPSAVQNLDGYGWGINDTCYNYIDFDRKVFVQKVGRVDLGTLTWNYNALGEPSYFYAFIANAVNSINVSCSLYESAVVLPTNTEDKIICITQNQVRIRDNELEGSIVDLNTKLNGVYLYYERATLVETDISAYLTTDTIDVEPNGTLEFTNTYSQDVPSDIDYLIEEVKA